MKVDELKNTKGQKFIFLNTRSLYSNISQLQLEFENSNVLCLCFCETWLTRVTDTRLVDIKGYKAHRLDRKALKRGGGLLIYTRNDLEVDILRNVYPRH